MRLLTLAAGRLSMSMTTSAGLEIPKIGYGLYTVPANEAKEATLKALSMGYRHLDSASFYGNEAEVGEAIAASGLNRESIFVGTKVWTDCIGLGPKAVEASVRKSLDLLKLDYLDCCYVHWPCPGYVDCYRTLEKLYDQGLIRGIGISNFRIEDYKELESHIRIKPIVNQIEVNPWMYRKETIDFFQNLNIQIVAYKPFLKGQATAETKILDKANDLKINPGQLLLRWLFDKGIIAIPRSQNEERMLLNFHTLDAVEPLDPDTTAYLDSIMSDNELANFYEHFSRRAVVDPSGPTLPVYYPAAALGN